MLSAGLVTGAVCYGPAAVVRLLGTKSGFESKERQLLGVQASRDVREYLSAHGHDAGFGTLVY